MQHGARLSARPSNEMLQDSLIRAAHCGDAEDMARVHVDTWQWVYQGLLPSAYLQSLSSEKIAREAQESLLDPQTCCLVAEGREGVIGYVCGGPERSGDPVYGGEIYELYLLPVHHRQGVGKRLVDALAHQLRGRLYWSLMVWVLGRNPNRRFYEKIGGLYLRSRDIGFAGRRLEAAAYGWIDITLAMRC